MENRLSTWNSKWKTKATGWHKSSVNCYLMNHYDKINLKQMPARVLVPLCGKTLDMKWLYDLGHHVVGIEGCDIPITEFFNDHCMKYCKEVLGGTECFISEDGRLKIYKCDLLTVETSLLGKFDFIWDRGSLVAIFAEDRIQYTNLMKQLFGPSCSYLIDTIVYDQSKFGGPPRSVPPTEIEKLFSDVCEVCILESVDRNLDPESPESPKMKWNIDICHEVILLLKYRNN